jgi:hypothetical protein
MALASTPCCGAKQSSPTPASQYDEPGFAGANAFLDAFAAPYDVILVEVEHTWQRPSVQLSPSARWRSHSAGPQRYTCLGYGLRRARLTDSSCLRPAAVNCGA